LYSSDAAAIIKTMEKLDLNAMKKANKKYLLDLIRFGNFSRAGLAKETGLTRSAISMLIDEMMCEGLVLDGEKSESAGAGRKSTFLRINSKFGYFAGVRINRGGYHIGLIDFCGEAIDSYFSEYPESESALAVIEKTIGELSRMIERLGISPKGIGITAPGPLSSETGTIYNPANFKKWHNLQIVNFFQRGFRPPGFSRKRFERGRFGGKKQGDRQGI